MPKKKILKAVSENVNLVQKIIFAIFANGVCFTSIFPFQCSF